MSQRINKELIPSLSWAEFERLQQLMENAFYWMPKEKANPEISSEVLRLVCYVALVGGCSPDGADLSIYRKGLAFFSYERP